MSQANYRKNFDRAYRLHMACVVKESRPDLAYISFRKSFAIASNGSLAVKARLTHISNFNNEELALLEGKSIHMDNFRRLLNYRVANVTERGFEVNDQGKRVLIYFNDQTSLSFTEEVEDIIVRCISNNLISAYRIGISASQMRIASQVMGQDTMKAEYYDGGTGKIYTYLTQLPVRAHVGVLISSDLLNE